MVKEMKKFTLKKIIVLFSFFLIFLPNFITIGYSNEIGITNGIYVNHTYRFHSYPEDLPSSLTFTKTSNDVFHVVWYLGGSLDVTGSWDVEINTRVVSNMVNFGPDNGDHNFAWIYTDFSLNDQIMIFNFLSSNDHLFNITGEAMHGSMEVWVLEDDEGSLVWYEKTKGFLVNGTFRDQSAWQKFSFESFSIPQPGISGYNYFLLLGCIFGFGTILIKYKSRNVKIS
jgi:hypothetical protein